MRLDQRDDLGSILGEAMLDDVLGNIVSILVGDEFGSLRMKLR